MSKAVSAAVEYSRTVKPADYESKAAKVAFTIVPQDEDSFITVEDVNFWLEKAQELVLVKVGLKKPVPLDAVSTPPTPVSATGALAKDAAKQAYADNQNVLDAAGGETKPKRTRKKADAPATTEDEELPLSTGAAKDAASAVPENTTSASVSDDDPLAILSAGEDEAPVTAGEMTKAITAKVVAYQKAGIADGGKRVTALILKHSPDKKLTQPNVILKAIEEHNQGRLFLEALEGLE